ncbi:S-layer homology domain-containing protein [Candidatus Gracilibacteria bacterium]|nr:S-layer homology domain-containing protein [Candidatus Gracilibacteria bacterium]PIQ41256.1 MAG: hypothetical protein COW06_03645 [Candidatus Gracilibacteria bacterium CG12_big_fil_rev_8_21_14_0_65_38_15]
MSNLFKKVTSTVSVVAIVASAMSASLVANAASSFTPYADALATAGIIAKQSTEAGYNLGNNVTRAEMAKVAVNIKGATVAECTGKVFSDVTSAIGDLCGYVEAAAEANLVNKIASKFRPMDLVTRAEMLKMLLSAKGIAATDEDQGFMDLGSDASLNGYINAAAKAGIINKGTSFNPNNNASRGEAFKVAANSAGLTTTATAETSDDLDLGDLFGDVTDTTTTTTTTTTDTTTTTTTTVVAAGDLEVALNPASHPNGTLIPQAGIVRFSIVDFTAGGSDISVNTVELQKSGLSTIPSGTKVWFEKAGTRISGKASFTSENNAVISFAPSLVVKAGSTESLDLYVELATPGSTGSDFAFVSAAITSSAANVVGSFATPTLRTATYTVAASEFTATTTGQDYNASSDSVELARFTVRNADAASDTRDLKFQSVALYQSGSADLANLSDIVVERNGVVVSSSAMVSGKTLTLTVNDTIKDGASAIYYVKAKINNVEQTTDTYQFYLKNTSDINIIETASAFRSTTTVVTSAVAGLYNVTGGDVKFERDVTSALSQTVAPGTSDVVLMQGTITAKSAVTLEDVTLNYTTSASGSTSMNTVYLQIGSATFTATPTDSSTTTGSLTFLGSATVSGTAPVKMYVKLKDAATGTIKVDSLAIGKFTLKEYTSNQNTVGSAIGSIEGITVTVGASTLNVTRTDGLGTTQLASGSKGVTVLGARFSSTQGNPIALSNLSVTTAGTANSYTGGNTTLTLYVDGVAKSTKSLTTTSVNFDGFNATVSTTKTVDIVVKADFSDVTTTGTFEIATVSYNAVDNLTSVTVDAVSIAGATFNIATAEGALAATTGDSLINRSLFTAGAADQKVASFKVTASNDVIKIKDIILTGIGLSALSNVRLTDSVGTVLGTASSLTNTGASFVNVDTAAGSSIAMDKSATYYVVANVNSSTNATGVQVNVIADGSTITGSNGGLVDMTGLSGTGTIVTGALHDVNENTFKVTLGTPTSKNLSTDAMRFTVNAFGKNTVTLSGATFNNVLSGYTGSMVLTVVRASDNALVGTGTTETGLVTFTGNNIVDVNSSVTYIVKVVGALVDQASTSQDWSVSLTNLTTTSSLDAANYPKNTDTFPLISVK